MTSLPRPGSAGDDGSPDPALADALASCSGTASDPVVLASLCRSRLLVPVVAIPGEPARGSSSDVDRSADIAAVLMQRCDGRKALLAFTGIAAMRGWNPDARPVPVSARDAARSALGEGADALLVDVAGPVMYAVETEDLRHLAAGHVMAPTSAGYVWLATDG